MAAKKHPRFDVSPDYGLKYVAEVDLFQWLFGGELEIKLLDGTLGKIPVGAGQLSFGFSIKSWGLPKHAKARSRGGVEGSSSSSRGGTSLSTRDFGDLTVRMIPLSKQALAEITAVVKPIFYLILFIGMLTNPPLFMMLYFLVPMVFGGGLF